MDADCIATLSALAVSEEIEPDAKPYEADAVAETEIDWDSRELEADADIWMTTFWTPHNVIFIVTWLQASQCRGSGEQWKAGKPEASL